MKRQVHTPAARSARFVWSVDSARWWKGRPEQIQVFLSEYDGQVLLGIGKANRVRSGYSSLGYRKPDHYEQSTRTLFYSFASIDHMKALLGAFDRATAYAAGLRKRPHHKLYSLRMNDSKILHESSIHLKSRHPGVRFESCTETLEVLCENANHRFNHKIYARDPEVRAAAKREWRRKSTPVPRYSFRLKRTGKCGDEEYRGFFGPGAGTEITIPLEAVGKVAEAIRSAILYLWSHISRYPQEADRRYLEWNNRWQLHRSAALDWVQSRVWGTLDEVEEPARFMRPALYRDLPRLRTGADDQQDALQAFHEDYIKRLQAYERGELHWRSYWGIHELQAQEDLERLNRSIHRARLKAMWFWLFVLTVLCSLKKRTVRRSPSQTPTKPRTVWMRCQAASPRTSRGPPPVN